MSTARMTKASDNISRQLRALQKKRTAPGKIKPIIEWPSTVETDYPPVSWDKWQAHLAQRSSPEDISQLFRTRKKVSPLLWVLPRGTEDPTSENPGATHGRNGSPTATQTSRNTEGAIELIDKLFRACRAKRSQQLAEISDEVESWLACSKDRTPTDGFALECVAMAWALPRLSAALDADTWWDLLAALHQLAAEATQISLDNNPLMHQPDGGRVGCHTPLQLS